MARLRDRGGVCCLISALLLVLCSCGGGASSSGCTPPNSSVQLSVQDGGSDGTVSSNPPGINCGQACSASYASGTQVALTAVPVANFFFAGWSGGCSGTGACDVTLMQNTSVVAKFSASPTLSVVLSGTGTVTSSPSNINCGKTCSATFNPGTVVTLTETPATGSNFVGWSGGCSGSGATCKVTLNDSTQVTASFTSSPVFSLTVNLKGSGKGTVASTPAGINCVTTCSGNFANGTKVTLSATAATGSYFAGWTNGACSGGNSVCVLTINSSQQVTATFTSSLGAVLTVLPAGLGVGTVTSSPAGINCGITCIASFTPGTQVTLTESADGSDTFAGWSGGGCSGTSPTCVLTLTANQQVTTNFTAPQDVNALNHIIILAQENRSFDSYFGALREYWAQNGYADQSFDGLPQFNPTSGIPPLYGPPPAVPGCNPNAPPPAACEFDPTNLVSSYHLITQCIENVDPLWNPSHWDWDYHDPEGNGPAMLNGFVWDAGLFARTQNFYDSNGIRAMGYYDGGDLNYYYFMATNFATSDRWFMPVMTRTSPNREYLDAATTQGDVYPIGTDQNDRNLLTATTIFQALQAAGISWKIYVDTTNSNCSGPPYEPTCLLTLSYIQNFQWGLTIPTQYPNNIAPVTQYFTDLQNGTLPQVALFEPATDAGYDEHPSANDDAPNNIQRGANYVSTLINGLMTSPYWKDSAFVFTFDEFGGTYDHVAPQPAVSPDGIKPVDLRPGDVCTQETGPLCDFVYTGYRVPMMVVSPYTKQNFVSHDVADNTAILKLIETRYNLSPLTKRDAAQIDMTEFFNFTNPVWITPPTPPAQLLNGACYLNQLP
jgi:phospholipase C